MNADHDNIPITNNTAEEQYEARVGGHLAIIAYERQGNRIEFLHTEVPDALEGHGIGSTMARFALEDARRQGLAVIPSCPFVNAYIRRHNEYADLIPADQRKHYLG